MTFCPPSTFPTQRSNPGPLPLQADSLPSEPPGKTHVFGMADTFKPTKRWNIQSWKPPQPKIPKSITVMFPEPRRTQQGQLSICTPPPPALKRASPAGFLPLLQTLVCSTTSSRTFPSHHQVYLLLFRVLEQESSHRDACLPGKTGSQSTLGDTPWGSGLRTSCIWLRKKKGSSQFS